MAEEARSGGQRITNRQFAAKIGTSESYASLIRAGKRLPGAAAMVAIVTAFGLDANDLVQAYRSGPRAVSEFLNEKVPRVE